VSSNILTLTILKHQIARLRIIIFLVSVKLQPYAVACVFVCVCVCVLVPNTMKVQRKSGS